MKKILLRILFFSPIFFVMIGVNLLVDPAHLVNSQAYAKGIADILLQEKGVAGLTNYDERQVQKEFIQRLPAGKEVIVLGSSRSMQITEDFFPGKSFFNNSVSGATIEDFIAIYELYVENDLQPSKVIIGVDPWLLNERNGQVRWRSLFDEYQRGSQRIGFTGKTEIQTISENPNIDKFKELISPGYFKSSLFSLIQKGLKKESYYPTDQKTAKVAIKKPDGSFSYDEIYSSAPTDQVDSRVIDAVRKPAYSLEDFSRIDPRKVKQYSDFVNYLRKQGIEVIIFLPPYHPSYYQFLVSSKNTRIILDVQSFFSEFGKQYGIETLGSYNPADIPCTKQDFFDEMHPKVGCLARIFNSTN